MPSPLHNVWKQAKSQAKTKAKELDNPKGKSSSKGKDESLLKKVAQVPLVTSLEKRMVKNLGGTLDDIDKLKNDPHSALAPSSAAGKIVEEYLELVQTYEQKEGLHEEIAQIYQDALKRIQQATLNTRRKSQVAIRKDIGGGNQVPSGRLTRSLTLNNALRQNYQKVLTEEELRQAAPITLIDHPNLARLLDQELVKATGVKTIAFEVVIADKPTLVYLGKMDSSLLAASLWQKAVDMKAITTQLNTFLKGLLKSGTTGPAADKAIEDFLEALADKVLLSAYTEIARVKGLKGKLTRYRLKKTAKVAMDVVPTVVMVATGWTNGVSAVTGLISATAKLVRAIKQEMRATEVLLASVQKDLVGLHKLLNANKSWKNLLKESAVSVANDILLNVVELVPTASSAGSKLDTVQHNNNKLENGLHKTSAELNKLLKQQDALEKSLKESKGIGGDDLKQANQLLQKLDKEVQTSIDKITAGATELEKLAKVEKTLREHLQALEDKKDAGKIGTAVGTLLNMGLGTVLKSPFTTVAQAVTNLDTSALALTQVGAELKTYATNLAKRSVKI